ncbi:MAG: zf-HC2 domain-containing protein [Gemmatimonadaceae bacterium]
MQHPDEGTIHAWLDRALSAEEAARIEAHVNECPECAAAVAEARGFIAASTRILTALDNVPKGAVPAVARNATSRNWMYWRAAAAVLVIAIGTVVVRREQTGAPQGVATNETPDTNPVPAFAPPIKVFAQKPAGPARPALTTVPSGAPGTSSQLPTSRGNEARVAAGRDASPEAIRPQNEATPRAVGAGTGARTLATAATTQNSAVAPTPQRFAPARPAVSGKTSGAEISDNKPGEATSASALQGASVPRNANGGIASDALAIEPPQLRALSARRVIGGNRTVYEVAPGDTVVLIESLPTQLNAVVVTGASETAIRTTARTSTGTTTAKPNAQTAQSNAQTAQPAPSAPPPATKQAAAAPTDVNTINTIAWTDPATGHTMELSGHHTPPELEVIRQRIERARAAEAAQKKKP